jgi:thymidylate synthase
MNYLLKNTGSCSHIYGEQWRSWTASDDGRKIDQLAWVIDTLKNFPERKHAVLSVWNPTFLYGMAKPGESLSFPLCHIMMHFNVSGNKLSCLLYQRSADMFLGVPFNIASYAMLTIVIAKICGYEPGEFVHTLGDAHIYENHVEQVREQLTREPKHLPRLLIDDSVISLDTFDPSKVTLTDYEPHSFLKGEMTVAGGFDEKDRK